jgi:hypothetical protein
MTAQTTTNTPADRADAALDTFVKTAGTEYNSTRDQLVDLIASAHHLARQLGIDWKGLINDASTVYAATKPAPEAKPAKAPTAPKAPTAASSAPRGEQYTIVTPTPNGEITNTRGKPYTHAAIVHTAAGWEVYALVSSKETAKKRLGDARRAGLAFDQHDVVETRIVGWAADPAQVEHDIRMERAQQPEVEVVELDAQAAIEAGLLEAPTAEQRRAAIAATFDAGALPPTLAQQPEAEIVREAEADEPMHVMIAGKATRGTMVHYSDDGLDTFCGCGTERDYRQVEDAVTCRSCLKVAAAKAGAK